MAEITSLARQALERGYLMSLGTHDDGGVWVADVIYVFDDELSLYWLSATNTRHSQAIQINPDVAAAITVDENPGTEFGLQLVGLAEQLEGERIELARKHWAKRGKPAPVPGKILDPGETWYQVIPTRIELIHQPEFGFTKQLLHLDDKRSH